MITVNAKNGVQYLRSDIISARHGFSTRIGGVSRAEHTSSLNLAFGRGDNREIVLQNLSLFADAVGFDAGKCISVSQIHSADVRFVTEAEAGQGYFAPESFSCDGYVTNVPGLTIGVKSADCVPILMEGRDKSGKILAVGAVHAGWRGTVSGIAVECIKKL
ncbi:MAG: laccase domain-containing protein, partial [Clostridia bacterium]|nr:laccase domain-containing protein [Clostridia bacterium]